MRTILSGIMLAFVLVGSGPGAAAEGDSPWSFELWNELMSPYCPGRTLADCPSESADQLRSWISDQEERGRSKQEVEAQLYERFGDVILQAPRPTGFGLSAYVIPALAFLAGGALVVWFLRRQARGAAAAAGPSIASVSPSRSDSELEALVDEELRRGEP